MTQPVKYYLDSQNRFVVENYNWAKPFSNFFPGIAGKWGIPLWVYYVSKGQGICSVGVHDKDHAILEFLSFNKACQAVFKQGFRTFLRVDGGPVYEPFQKVADDAVSQSMIVSSHELEITELNTNTELEIRMVTYPLANMPLAGLVRQVSVKNTGSETREVELIDGLPSILPYGVTFEHTNVIARHIEGMMGVFKVNGLPLFRLKQTPSDVEEIGQISGGNFYFSIGDDGVPLSDHLIVDPYVVFGEAENHDFPWFFEQKSVDELLDSVQIMENRTPSALTALGRNLSPGETITFHSIIGFADDEESLTDLTSRVETTGFLQQKRAENRDVIDQIKNFAFTVSGEPTFDQYSQQTFLDNVMRGGMPVTFESGEHKSFFYTYARQNGDLERDYHWFVLEATYLSQGNGHYRSILQNRRMDSWFFPEIEDLNILTYLNLVQTDGYNPLVVNGLSYTVEDSEQVEAWLKDIVPGTGMQSLLELVSGSFTPGEFIRKLEASAGQIERPYEELLAELLALCTMNEIGALHEGYWQDHWFYNLDTIETFRMIYPDRWREALLEKRAYTFFDNPDIVQPRERKSVLVDGQIRQYGSVVRDPEKQALIESREEEPHKVRTQFGQGEIYSTSLLVKLLCIIANRMASLDPAGIGVEMEAGKPGWLDSLNGLPGVFGSSLNETLELERASRLLRESLSDKNVSDSDTELIYGELHTFISGLGEAIGTRLASQALDKELVFWEESQALKESYRAATRLGIDGHEEQMTMAEVRVFLERCLSLIGSLFDDSHRAQIYDEAGVPHTYFISEVEEYTPTLSEQDGSSPLTNSAGNPLVRPRSFDHRPMALFLEGPVHMLRVHKEQARPVYEAVRQSELFDRQMQMFRCCAWLKDEPFEIGRIKSYARGWIENESVYTHMEYKWLREVLRSGLHEEFFTEARNALVPFLEPETYGRSILENCSFIVSSVFPDPRMHGQAFQPRLSGVTCEFLDIWANMVAGEQPFFLDDDGELRLSLQPILPDWFFTTADGSHRYWDMVDGWVEVDIPENCFAFKFIGRTLVIYHNPERKPTYGTDGVRPTAYTLTHVDGSTVSSDGDTLDASLSTAIREGRIRQIDVILA
jgi:hypothetical protein